METRTTKTNRGTLAIFRGGRQTQAVQLELDRYEIGRGESAELSFADAVGMSRRHAAIERDGAQWIVRDLGSTNGTFLNGARLEAPRALRSGDRVNIADLDLVFDEPMRADRTVVFVSESTPSRNAALETTLHGALDTGGEMGDSPHMRALVQAGRELCGHLSLDELFQVIMQLSIDTVGASRGVLLTMEGGEFQVRATKGAGFQISSHVRDLVVKERRSLLVRDAMTDEALSARMSIVQDQIRGILAAPLQTDKNVIGLIYLDSPLHLREFTRDDLNVLTVLANIAAIRIEQARLAEIEQAERMRAKELEHATLIQRSMLPAETQPFPDRKDFDLFASMAPAKEVGGDLFDFFLLDEDHLAFAIGDVSGKGVPAALFMAVARTLLRAAAQSKERPGEVFARMNRGLVDGNSMGMFVTFFYGVLNTATGELEYANAGHNPPYVFSQGGTPLPLAQRSGPMLGLFEEQEYRTHSTQIEPGQGILLYTDGVTEALSKEKEFFGDERLQAFLGAQRSEGAEPLVRALHAAVAGFASGMPQADDITVLGLLYRGL
ncbi:MAG TPA: SpoIIE family protein phosphatase [Bryobacteraceae bacterium]|nr:SpoIIE family protein phosphatase [Bryobacteraceae bacterium]